MRLRQPGSKVEEQDCRCVPESECEMSIGPKNKEEPTPGNQQAGPEIQAPRSKEIPKWHSPSSVELPVVEPWPEAVDGKDLLDNLVRELQRFVVFPKWAAVTFALWILHTFAFRLRDVTTYIGIESPERECGKSTLLTVCSRFVRRAAV